MVRLKDIAARTGLTVATVSKALNHSPEISAATTELIKRTAREMGYSSRKPSRKETKTIGVIFPEVRSHYYSELLHALNCEIDRQGYTMIAMATTQYAASPQALIEKMCRFDPDGLFVCCDNHFSRTSFRYLMDSDVPTLLLTEIDLPYQFDSIYIKNDFGVRLAVDHLVQLGHRRIGYLGEYKSDVRYEAFCNAMNHHRIPMNHVFMKRGEERFEEGGYLRAMELLKEKELPTAVVACYDQLAFGAMRAFRERGVRVPEDVSIIGFDNIVMDAYHPVPLTSITNPVDQMGIEAVKILLDAIQNPSTHVVQNVALQSRLVARASTCPPRDQG